MPDIQAFRGLRYDLGHVGSLSDVTAPPYDVISPEDQEQLYKKHPANCIRLILNRPEPGDDERSNVYTRASRFFKDWQRQGVLFRESDPAVYAYHQEFHYGGQSLTRRGFLARVRLQRFGEGNIYPHEETMSGPKEDRLKLTIACKANLSAIFGLYPEEQSAAQSILEKAIAGQTPLSATDHLGVEHKLWPVTDGSVISALTGAMGGKSVFIADGHHRYETACNYRDLLIQEHGPLDQNHPANFVLMTCVSMSDPGMVVFPTHRLFRGLPEVSAVELHAALDTYFSLTKSGEGPGDAQKVWDEMELADEQSTLGLYTVKDKQWTLARLTDAGRAKMAEAAAEHSDDWQSLGVAILQRLVMQTLLKADKLPKPGYVHQVFEVSEGLKTAEYQLAALVMPPSLDLIQSVSRTLERMPAKSTYFYPKLLTGLVFNPLE